MAGIENHDALVGQHQERRIVVVVGLEIAAHEHLFLALNPILADLHLRCLHVSVNVDVAHVGYTFII